MSLPTVFETCEPREDVLSGAIADAEFAADLAKVIRGTASEDYKIPARFFANTYPTAGLKNLLRNVLARLTGDPSAAACIFRLDTSYGGGKTHGLIALTHAANGMKGVANVAENPNFVPTSNIRIAAFDGENADPANGRSMDDGILAHTPWGELACSLAGANTPTKPLAWLIRFASPHDLIILTNTATVLNSGRPAAHVSP